MLFAVSRLLSLESWKPVSTCNAVLSFRTVYVGSRVSKSIQCSSRFLSIALDFNPFCTQIHRKVLNSTNHSSVTSSPSSSAGSLQSCAFHLVQLSTMFAGVDCPIWRGGFLNHCFKPYTVGCMCWNSFSRLRGQVSSAATPISSAWSLRVMREDCSGCLPQDCFLYHFFPPLLNTAEFCKVRATPSRYGLDNLFNLGSCFGNIANSNAAVD